MAEKPLRPCNKPGCSALTREGYCPKHKPAKAARHDSAQWHSWYSRKIWTDDLRPAQLMRDPFCCHCRAQGIRQRASVVDHRVPFCLLTRALTRACANAATTARRRWNRLKDAKNETVFRSHFGTVSGQLQAHAHWVSAPAGFLAGHPHPEKFHEK